MKPNFLRETILAAKEQVLIQPSVEVLSNQKAALRGKYRILEYSDEWIRIQLEGLQICLYGSGLELDSVLPESLEIRGTISRIEYEPSGERL